RAYNAAGNSGYSNEAYATTDASSGGGAGIIGYDLTGSSSFNISGDAVLSKFNASSSGTLDSMAYFVPNSSANRFKLYIYADNGGEPGSKLAETADQFVNNGTNKWYKLALNTSLSISDGSDYWLGVDANSQFFVSYDAGGVSRKFNNTSGTTAPDPWNTSGDEHNTWKVSTYAWGSATKSLKLGVVEPSNNVGMRIFPNPTNGSFISIELSEINEDYELSIIDLSGKILFNSIFNRELELLNLPANDLGISSKGIYMIRVVSGDHVLIKKVIIQ
ncbi:MAG: T9SS type A sorting domain-containing protein, partial [Bacteroidales bacterium]